MVDANRDKTETKGMAFCFFCNRHTVHEFHRSVSRLVPLSDWQRCVECGVTKATLGDEFRENGGDS